MPVADILARCSLKKQRTAELSGCFLCYRRKEDVLMAELLDQLRVWIEQIILTLGYGGIVLLTLLETIFPPIPSELVIPFAGFLVAQEELSFAGVLAASTLGSVLGALVLYAVGQRAGDRAVRAFLRRYGYLLFLSEQDYNHTLQLFERHGAMIVLSGRLLPLARSLISIPAGMNRMPLGTFLLYTTLGSAAWSALLTAAGFLLGENWQMILVWVDRYEHVALTLLVLAIVLLMVRHIRKHIAQKRQTQSTTADEEQAESSAGEVANR